MIHGIHILITVLNEVRLLFVFGGVPLSIRLYCLSASTSFTSSQFLFICANFRHVSLLLTLVTGFILKTTPWGIVISTTPVTLWFPIFASRFWALFDFLTLPVVFPPKSIKFFDAISCARAVSTAFSKASSLSANNPRVLLLVGFCWEI